MIAPQDFGGRKFSAFLILVALLALFVLTGKLSDQALIVQAYLGLLGLYAGANVLQKGVQAVRDVLARPAEPAP